MSNKPLMERYKPSQKILQQHIEQIMLVLAVLLATLPHLLIVWDCQTRLTTISADALYALFSTSASVVAGLYGITLTGYIFFLEHIQRDSREDETLSDPIALLKRDYNRLALFITVLAFLSLMANGFQLLYGAENALLPEGVHRFLMDETLWLTSATIFCIMCFILLVVAPDKIQRISERYKKRIDGSGGEEGGLQQFLEDYRKIEDLLRKLAGKMGSSFRIKDAVNPAGLLKGMDLMEDTIWEELNLVRSYHGYVLHSSDKRVSQEMCDFTASLKASLKKMLDDNGKQQK